MGKKMLCIVGVLFLALCAATSSQAVVFTDNFNSENGGQSYLNYGYGTNPGFANWNVTNGSVDLVANGDYGISGQGSFVDLDGSTNQAGIMSTKTSFAAGTYTLSFDLSGNQRGYSPDVVHISLGSWSASPLTLSSGDPWQTFSYTFTTSGGSLVFHNDGGDNVGALLDNVKLSSVPLPPSVLLLAPGLLGFVGVRRRFKA